MTHRCATIKVGHFKSVMCVSNKPCQSLPLPVHHITVICEQADYIMMSNMGFAKIIQVISHCMIKVNYTQVNLCVNRFVDITGSGAF